MLGIVAGDMAARSQEAALKAIRQACEQGVLVVSALADPLEAFSAATSLAETMRQLAQPVADLRADSAARLQKAEGLSIAQLGRRVGLSKARAAQLLRIAAERSETSARRESCPGQD